MPSARPLTTKQNRVLRYITSYYKRKGFFPTFGEIGTEFTITKGAVVTQLRLIRKKGLIDWGADKRSFVLYG